MDIKVPFVDNPGLLKVVSLKAGTTGGECQAGRETRTDREREGERGGEGLLLLLLLLLCPLKTDDCCTTVHNVAMIAAHQL